MSDKMNELMAQLSQKLNMSPEKVQSAAEKGDVDTLLQNSDCDNAQVREILSDPEKQRQILNSPQAQAFRKLWQRNQAPEFCRYCNNVNL